MHSNGEVHSFVSTSPSMISSLDTRIFHLTPLFQTLPRVSYFFGNALDSMAGHSGWVATKAYIQRRPALLYIVF